MRRSFFAFSIILVMNAIAYPLALDSVIIRSDSCVAIEWTPDSSNTDGQWYTQYGTRCTSSDSIYRHCDFIAGRSYSGIAYSYGGEDPWYTFRMHLAAGYLVGSHQCHYNVFGDPSSKVTGTDCSGFLCFVWDIPRTNTTDLYNNNSFITIPRTEVIAGDALVKASSAYGYHAILIVEAEDPTEVVIAEASSTVFGCRQRVVDLTSSTWSSYKAIRNPALQGTQRVVTSAENSFQTCSITRLGNNQITIQLYQPVTGKLSGYDLNGRELFKIPLDNQKTEYAIAQDVPVSRLILLSIQSTTFSGTFRLSLLK
ncbi:MAG TPA: hypothetical protein VHO70_19990 [Chitinispirillaceae bacterium]|nr:hypothetical protein [Chitinispirillaceae bacterium]